MCGLEVRVEDESKGVIEEFRNEAVKKGAAGVE